MIPGQIDWAALAQAWIAQREASGQQGVVEQQGMMPNGQEMAGMEPGPNNHGNFQGDPNFNRMWQPGAFLHFSAFGVLTLPCPSLPNQEKIFEREY